MRSAPAVPDLASWRAHARELLAARVAPADVVWTPPGGTGLLFEGAAPVASATADAAPAASASAGAARVPARFVALAADAILHRAASTQAILYRVLWRLVHGEPRLLDDAADADVRAIGLAVHEVRRDLHKMHAFVRFRQIDAEHFAAWYAPDHHIVERAAAFFVERFAAMRWSIFTPDQSVAWDGAALRVLPGVPRRAAPASDELEALWRTYYAAIFNPSRANVRAMRQHMPQRFWSALPETADIPGLLAAAAPRVDAMLGARAPHVPEARALPVLADAARRCTACDLCGPATQTVFGEGRPDAALVLVGEQPGDQEDLAGRPFVGPAGEVLDAALARAGIDRAALYVTNAVKHFRFLPRGKKRLHQRPTVEQVRACRPWLIAELQAIRPRAIVCLGATAAHALLGSRVQLRRDRGRAMPSAWADHVLVTHHPAALLRVDPSDRARLEVELITDLTRAGEVALRGIGIEETEGAGG